MVKKRVVEVQILQDSRNPTVREVIEAFELAFDDPSDQPTTVTFYTDDARDEGLVRMQVTALEYETGTRGAFLIRGQRRDGNQSLGELNGFYNANIKAGHLLQAGHGK